jgi:hypothetical protein
MRRGLGPPDLDGSVIHMHLRGVLGGEETGRQVTYLAGVVHGIRFSSVSRKSNRLCLPCFVAWDSRWPGWTSHVPNQTEQNPSKLKLHTEFWFPWKRSSGSADDAGCS